MLPLDESTSPPSYRHWRSGRCPCGETHNPAQDRHQSQAQLKPPARALTPWKAEGPVGRLTTETGRPFRLSGLGTPIEAYNYRNAGGTTLYKVIRYDHPKDFRPWIWNGQKLVCTLPDAERMPYRLPELLATPLEAPVFLVEGEKACNALVAQGLAATCASGGAQARWHEQFNTYFAGRRVVILPDNDAPGQKCMQARAPGLANVAASLKVLDLPGLPPKGDAFDYFAVGGSVADLLRLVGQTQEWQPGKQEEEDASEYDALLEKLTFSLDDLLEEEHPPLKWAVEGFIPEGLTLLAGKPKVGKSWLVLSIGLAIAYGGYALGKIKVEQGDVLYLALEDRKKRLKNRAEKVGAIKGKNQHFIMATEWPRLGDGGKELLEAWIKKHPDTRLIIIDTLAKIKSHSPAGKTLYDEDYQSLEPLQALSQQYSVPIVVITHLRKMDAEDAFDTINASLGLNGVADTLLVLKKQRGKADAVLCGVGREGDEFEKVIRFDPATCTWILQGDAENYVPTEERRRIIEALAKAAPKALTPREIAHQIDAEANNVTQLLFKLKTAGQVITPSYGKYTIPNNTDKTDKSDESKTSEAEAEEAEEAEAEEPGEEYTDKTGDKTFEPVAADGDRSLITLTTLIEFDNELETPPAQPDDLAAQWIATYGPKPLPLAAQARANIAAWAKERHYPSLKSAYANFADQQDWRTLVPRLSDKEAMGLAAYLKTLPLNEKG